MRHCTTELLFTENGFKSFDEFNEESDKLYIDNDFRTVGVSSNSLYEYAQKFITDAGDFTYYYRAYVDVRSAHDYCEDYLIKDSTLASKVEIGDYLLLPVVSKYYTTTNKSDSFSIKKYLNNGYDYCCLHNKNESKDLLDLIKSKKDLPPSKYKNYTLEELSRQFLLTNTIKLKPTLKITNALLYLVAKAIDGSFYFNYNDVLVLTEIKDVSSFELLSTYFTSLGYIKDYSNNITFDYIKKEVHITSKLFRTLFKNSFDNYNLIQQLTESRLDTLINYLKTFKNYIIFDNIEQLNMFKHACWCFNKHKYAYEVDDTTSTYIVDLDGESSYLRFNHNTFLVRIKDIVQLKDRQMFVTFTERDY